MFDARKQTSEEKLIKEQVEAQVQSDESHSSGSGRLNWASEFCSCNVFVSFA